VRAAAAVANTGSGIVAQPSVNGPPPVDANLLQPVTITFTGPNTFDVTGVGTGNPVGVVYTPGADITYNGWTIQITGAPAATDVFTVSANTGGYNDNRNAQALSDVMNGEVLNGSTASFLDAYGQLVAEVGTATHRADLDRAAQSALLDQVTARRDSVSGVNLDEEAANMLRFQQAYQAAAQMISASGTLFQTLLGAIRG